MRVLIQADHRIQQTAYATHITLYCRWVR